MSGVQKDSPSPSAPLTPNNLPLQLTSFVGRVQEIVKIREKLADTRLLTLTGSGGVGKTRLGLQVASSVLGEFEHGVWFVELAALDTPPLVLQEIISTLGVRGDTTRSKLVTLQTYIQDKKLLLLLDNCEHLVTACAELAEQLLKTSPELNILATSREPLGVRGEVVSQVSPLSFPDPQHTHTLDSLRDSEACQLFVERAQSVQPDFQATPITANAIAQVCQELDGIPLAIELAATRVNVLSVSQIAAYLSDRFRLLTGGSRTALPRHQTLQAAIGWSYDLLTAPEQQVFQRLAVFSGGFTLQATEYVVGGSIDQDVIPPTTILDLLSNLVDKSLVVARHAQETRYRMLETIRQFAREKLQATDEVNQVRLCHLEYYLSLAKEAEPRLRGDAQIVWLDRLELEQDNLRAALAWSLESDLIEHGARLASALSLFWDRRGYLDEGSGWLHRFLSDPRLDDLLQARILIGAARLALDRKDHKQALELSEQSLELCRQYGDRKGTAQSLQMLGVIAHWFGERERGADLLEESLSLFHELDDEMSMMEVLLHLADIRLRQGDNKLAATLWQESLGLARKLNDPWGIAFAQSALGEAARREGDFIHAVNYLQSAIKIHQEASYKVEIIFTLEALAMTIAEHGSSRVAAQLWGAADAFREAIHAPLPPSYRPEYAPYIDSLKAAIGEDIFAAAYAEGKAMNIDQVTELAMSIPMVEIAPVPAPVEKSVLGMTPREVEVLRLVATGLTDAQVAEVLVISPRTVSKHLQSIYSKLAIQSRSAATRFAIEHSLI